ncbi:MAG: YodL domain-containing protein, partial [Clostridia bacterium]
DKLNLELGVYPQQAATMLGGSMFGWDTPAARVTCYNMQGEPIPPTKQQAVSVTKTGVVSSQSAMDANFLHTHSDAFAIYQLKTSDSTRHLRFEPLARLQQTGKTVDRANYQCVYTAPLPINAPKTPMEQLHVLYEQLNIAHPADFTGHSLSVSDVVALKQDGQITCYYVDRWSFEKLTNFLPAVAEKKREKPTVAELLKPKPHNRNSTNQLLKKNIGRDTER